MKFTVNEASAHKMAALEEGCSVTAGSLDIAAFKDKVDRSREKQEGRDSHVAIFGKLVELKRRDLGLSREELAELARIDVVELFQVETNLDEVPEPRVVSRLSRALEFPAGKMMQLVGHLSVVDTNVSKAALKFAACSGSMQALTADEKKALGEFVHALAED